MQIRTGDDIFSEYGSPSRPISPTTLSNPAKTTSGNEPGKIDNQTPTPGLQPEPESRLHQHIHQQQSATLPPAFPPELIDHIVDHLHDDKQSLIQCSRTSRVFSHATSYHLFRTVRVLSVRPCVQFQELVRSSLHPSSSASTAPHPPPCPPLSSPASPTSFTAALPPASHTAHSQSAQTHPHTSRIHTDSHTGHTHTSAGWDISKFVRKIEFYRLDLQSPIAEYVSEAVKLVRMLPRIQEVVFGWWMQSTGLEQIGRAFAADQPVSSVSTHKLSETQADPLKLHLELVDFDSAHAFLDVLGSFGGRLRELSLANVTIVGGDGNGKSDTEGRRFPGLKSVCLGYEAVVQPKGFGGDGPMLNMNMLFGMSAFDQQRPDMCEILERIAPNVSELQLFREDAAEVHMGLQPAATVLRLPRFRKLNLVTMYVPGPRWSDLIYEIAAWFAKDDKSLGGEMADPTCHDDSPSFSVTHSLPSNTSATQANRWEDWKRTRIRFTYPVRKGDVDWGRLENAVLGEDLDGKCDCAGIGNHGCGVERESGGGDENDQAGAMLMRINHTGKRGAGSVCSGRSTAGSLWVEVGDGSTELGEVGGDLGRLGQLGLLQVSCK